MKLIVKCDSDEFHQLRKELCQEKIYPSYKNYIIIFNSETPEQSNWCGDCSTCMISRCIYLDNSDRYYVGGDIITYKEFKNKLRSIKLERILK